MAITFIKILKAAKNYLTKADYRFTVNTGLHLYDKMEDWAFLKKKFKISLGKELDLDNPKTYNEKLQWIKLYDRKPEYTMMADKYAVRKYISEKLGDEYLVPLIGVWDNPDDIDFDKLPDKFVLKCNHNSGLGMCICKDKSKLDIKKVKKSLKRGLKQNYYLLGREWPYKDIKHKIIAEQYLENDDKSDIQDYKILCFNGEPKLIELHKNRFSDHTQDFYDTTWKKIDITQDCKQSDIVVPAPECLNTMLDFSKLLSKDIPHVRVDWYFVKGRLYFGELTFFDSSGFAHFKPELYDKLLGDYIDLKNKTYKERI
ncbi:MAG: glycosyl transferase [Ruminococcaceae bacterium]|nr:glycosyl transferase [Oscillospiraceae bacterium]